jgi:hypothetical protein
MDSTSHLHTYYIGNDSCAYEYFKTHNTTCLEPNWFGWKEQSLRLRVRVTQDTKEDNTVGGAITLAAAQSDTTHNAL